MRYSSLDQLALLTEEQAVQRHFDSLNERFLRLLYFPFLSAAFAIFVAMSDHTPERQPQQFPLAVVNFFTLLSLFFLWSRAYNWRFFRGFTIGVLITEYVVAVSIFFMHPEVRVAALIFFPPILFFLRLRPREYLFILAAFVTALFIAGLLLGDRGVEVIGIDIVLPAMINGFIIGLSLLYTRMVRNRFVTEWSAVAHREKERLRMRDEIEVARRIQLAMLPDAPPPVEWLDISSMSSPATEVGGDFYEYFELEDERIALIIGDVAGHGVSSGLVLSAVKSGLFLLRDQLDRPDGAIASINEMVRSAIRWRMLVSLLIAIVDRQRGTLRVIAAGHPPLFLWSHTTQTITRVGQGSLPLGTNLPTTYGVEEQPIGSGDVLLLVTDGVTEAARDAEMFGDERISALISSYAGEGAVQLRDVIAAEVSRFRGDMPLEDDTTIVVAKVR